MLWVLKRTVSMSISFKHPKHMFKLMDKEIITLYAEIFSLTGHMHENITDFEKQNFAA